MKNNQRPLISAIIPIFNEEKTVGEIIETLLTDLVDEIICVNDGSSDDSLNILKSFGTNIKLINLKRNYGKGFALAAGIKRAKGNFVAFFDSDLLNLSEKHVKQMLAPILDGQARAVLGVPTEGDKKYLYRLWNIYLTGERVYPRKSLLPHVESLKKAKYGVEIYLSSLFKRKETKIVYLQGLISPNKYEKRSPIEASKEYFREGAEIALEIGKKEILSQEDYRRIINFAKAKTMIELKEKIEEIKNKNAKRFLESYVLKYIIVVQRRIHDFTH